MNDKKDFNKKSNQLIESFEKQNKILNSFLEKLDKEYQVKFEEEKQTKDMNNEQK